MAAAASVLPLTILSLLAQNYIAVCLGAVLIVVLLFLVFKMRLKKARLDSTYVLATLHMYSTSTAEAGPENLVGVIAGTEEYGFISLTFKKIMKLAKNFGYGFTKATAYVSQSVKPPLKDFLMRCTEIFSSRRPSDYLEIEVTTLMEEYSGTYSRALESLRLMGGIFSTFQSAIVFIIMTLSILTVFLAEGNIIYIAYGVSFLSLIMLFIGFRASTPKEKFFYKGEASPRHHRRFSLTLMLSPALIIPSVAIYVVAGAPLAFIMSGAGLIIPGIFAYRLERYVENIEAHYPTFIKAVSESMVSVTDLKSALSYVLYMELGPSLRKIVQKTVNRLKLGISTDKSMDLFSSETGSHLIFLTNRIFLGAFKYGGDLVEVGKKIGNSTVKFLELRKRRKSVSRSFEGIVLIMHPITVALLVVMMSILGFFSETIINLPYFTFGEIPIKLVETGNIIIVLFLSIMNAVCIKDTRGGFWGIVLLYAGLLLILSGLAWFATDRFIADFFKQAIASLRELEFA